MNDKTDLESALRASLAERARHAPQAEPVAARILADVELLPVGTAPRRPSRWRTWSLPLVAAGSVAAIVGALVGVSQFRHSAEHGTPIAPVTSVIPTPTATAPTSPAPTPTPTNPIGLTNFRVIDLTFVSEEEGWGLGTADCLTGSGSCTAMVHTIDGGKTWGAVQNPPANVGNGCSAEPCVAHIRFANNQIGYAYGRSALFMTTDGGATWHQQSGGADALETLDGNVIRITTSPACSPPGCRYNAQTAPIGSSTWHDVGLSATNNGMSVGVSLARSGGHAFLEVFGHTAGGAQDATSALYTSADGGASWTNRGEPCPQVGGKVSDEVDSTALATASDGSVTLVCTGRGDQYPQFTMTSIDGGATFRTPNRAALGASPISALGAASASVLIISSDDMYRSTDGGKSWQRLGANGNSDPGQVSWIGFESSTVGRAIDGRTIWTTRDAGLTWTPYTFP
jgi:photosystem II stability/assembly factor-like uncharacterized protein